MKFTRSTFDLYNLYSVTRNIVYNEITSIVLSVEPLCFFLISIWTWNSSSIIIIISVCVSVGSVFLCLISRIYIFILATLFFLHFFLLIAYLVYLCVESGEAGFKNRWSVGDQVPVVDGSTFASRVHLVELASCATGFTIKKRVWCTYFTLWKSSGICMSTALVLRASDILPISS